MNRESGFYWVKFSDNLDWEIAEWESIFKTWLRTGSGYDFKDSDFLEIDENRIIRSK